MTPPLETMDSFRIDRPTKELRRPASGNRAPCNQAVKSERRSEGRRSGQRRRQIDPTTCERDYTNDEIEFMRALDDYKRSSGRMFPTCSEILEVLRGLGYVRIGEDGTARPAEISGAPTPPDTEEDWED